MSYVQNAQGQFLPDDQYQSELGASYVQNAQGQFLPDDLIEYQSELGASYVQNAQGQFLPDDQYQSELGASYVQNAQGHFLPDDIVAQSELGWGARNVTGPMTRQQLRSMAALMLAQGLPATSPGPSLKTLYQMKGDAPMPHSVPGFGPEVGHFPPLYPREGGVYVYRPTVSGPLFSRPVNDAAPTRQHLRMMQQRHTPRRSGFRPFHRRIHVDIDFDANVQISGESAPMITIMGDFDPLDPIMGSFLSNIARSVTRTVSSVAKTVAKPVTTIAKAVVKPTLKIALAPVKTAVNIVTKPKATLKAVTRAVRNPVGTLRSIPGAVVRQVTAVPKTAIATVKALPKATYQAAKETVQAANVLRQTGIVKAGVAGLAVAIPPVGIPAAAALALTQKVVNNAKSLNPVVAANAKAVIVGTAQQAKTGDPDAKRAIALMAAHGKVAAQNPKQKEFHFRVTEQGRIQRIA